MVLAASAALLSVACGLQAQTPGMSGYLTDARGQVLRNANYMCWHTGYWTPSAAIAECEPDLVARPVAAAKPSPPAAGEKQPVADKSRDARAREMAGRR